MKRNRVVYYTAILGWLYIIVEYALRVSDSVIVDHLMADFGVAAAGIGVLSSAYYIPYVFMQFPAGILIDRFGLKLSWTHGIFLVTLGSYLFAKSTSLEVATLARILMGIGSAFALIGTIKLIHANFSHKYHAFFIGITMTICAFGAASGQIAWVHATNWAENWRTPYVVAAVFGVLIIVALQFCLRGKNHLHLEKEKRSEKSLKQILQTANHLLKNKTFWFLACFIAVLQTPQTAFTALWGVKFLTDSFGIPHEVAARLIATVWIGGLFGAPILGLICDRIENKVPLLIFVGLVTSALMGTIIFSQIANQVFLTVILFLLGFFTSGNIIIFSIVCKMFNDLPTATVIGVTNTFNMGSGPIFQLIIGFILSWYSSETIYALKHYQTALSIIPIALIVSSMSLLFLSKAHLKSTHVLPNPYS